MKEKEKYRPSEKKNNCRKNMRRNTKKHIHIILYLNTTHAHTKLLYIQEKQKQMNKTNCYIKNKHEHKMTKTYELVYSSY